MSDYIFEFTGVFWLSLAGIITASFSVCLGYALKSKCTETNLCFGILRIKRDVQAELEEEKMELDHIPRQSDNV
jgi:hypothetical protein